MSSRSRCELIRNCGTNSRNALHKQVIGLIATNVQDHAAFANIADDHEIRIEALEQNPDQEPLT